MARSQWIIPRADSACGRAFHPDRKTAEGHRIALEFWIQATGRAREGRRLVSFRCGRCGGFHVASRKVDIEAVRPEPSDPPYATEPDWEADPEFDVDETSIDVDLEAVS
jgi:hypothetical protein